MCCQPKQKVKRKLYRKVFERINESKWGTSYESIWIKWKMHAFALGSNITHECLLSQSVIALSSSKCSQWWCVLKKIFNGEIIFHLKRRLKRLCYYKWKAWYKLLPSSGLKKNKCTFLSSTRHPSEEQKMLDTKYCVAIPSEKKKEWIIESLHLPEEK